MLHTYVEERRVRVRQVWPRAGSERMKRTFTVREILSEVSTAADGGAIARAQRFLPV